VVRVLLAQWGPRGLATHFSGISRGFLVFFQNRGGLPVIVERATAATGEGLTPTIRRGLGNVADDDVTK